MYIGFGPKLHDDSLIPRQVSSPRFGCFSPRESHMRAHVLLAGIPFPPGAKGNQKYIHPFWGGSIERPRYRLRMNPVSEPGSSSFFDGPILRSFGLDAPRKGYPTWTARTNFCILCGGETQTSQHDRSLHIFLSTQKMHQIKNKHITIYIYVYISIVDSDFQGISRRPSMHAWDRLRCWTSTFSRRLRHAPKGFSTWRLAVSQNGGEVLPFGDSKSKPNEPLGGP